jgi:hypothetical protein
VAATQRRTQSAPLAQLAATVPGESSAGDGAIWTAATVNGRIGTSGIGCSASVRRFGRHLDDAELVPNWYRQ